MRRIAQRKRFRKTSNVKGDTGKTLRDLIAAVEMLAETGRAPVAYRPQSLSGEWKGVWECHIDADWLLIYAITTTEVLLIRTGSHSGLVRVAC